MIIKGIVKKCTYILMAVTVLSGCALVLDHPEMLKVKAPQTYTAVFETTKGNFVIEVNRSWSPAAADRLYQLIENNYFTDAPVYRMIPGFVAQFGHLDKDKTSLWQEYRVPDEPVVKGNTKGTVAFARFGRGTRTSQIFINLEDNSRLDTIDFEGVVGFPVIGTVISGMDTAQSFYSYENEPAARAENADDLSEMLKTEFPRMDYILQAYIRR